MRCPRDKNDHSSLSKKHYYFSLMCLSRSKSSPLFFLNRYVAFTPHEENIKKKKEKLIKITTVINWVIVPYCVITFSVIQREVEMGAN